MIFHFSGTGNSLWVAGQLSEAFDEKLISISEELKKSSNDFNYQLRPEEKVFFVFPVHSWGPAVLISRFIKKMNLQHYAGQKVYVVCTCGDNCGNTDKIIRKRLKKKNITLSKVYSIQMPNNYILMKGFGIDSKELENIKLAVAPDLVKDIINNINSEGGKEIYERGKSPFVKSGIVYPLFARFALGRNSFYATDACTSCKLCVKICPTQTISMSDNRPVWNNTCVQCTACIHRCPVRAIEHGKITQDQGRYHHPDIR